MKGTLIKYGYGDNEPWLVIVDGELLQLPLYPEDAKQIEEDMGDYPNVSYIGEKVDFTIHQTLALDPHGELSHIMYAKLTDPLNETTIDDVAESFYNNCTYVFKDKLTECGEINGILALMMEFAKSDAVKQYHLNNK